MADGQHMEHSDRDLVKEARVEVKAAKQNLDRAVVEWETRVAALTPANMELRAARTRMERADALLRAALGEMD